MNSYRSSLIAFFVFAFLALAVVQAGADTPILLNTSFEEGTFDHWTLGTTSNGTAGQGFPIVTQWPLDHSINAWEGQVGEVKYDGTFQGATLSQSFLRNEHSGPNSARMGFSYTVIGGPGFGNIDGGDFRLYFNGALVAEKDVGPVGPNQVISGLVDAEWLPYNTQGWNTFEIDILRNDLTASGPGYPHQYVTSAFFIAAPEPGSLILLGSGILGLAGVLRRKLNF